MARVKKADMPPPPPKHPRECKHGCTDCIHYRLDVKAFPCRDCERWNYWEDAHPEKTDAVPFPPPVSVPDTQAPIPTDNEPKRRARCTQVTAPQTDTPPIDPEQPLVLPKKRGRKPATDATIAENIGIEPAQSSIEPANHARKLRQKAEDKPALPSMEKDQMSFF